MWSQVSLKPQSLEFYLLMGEMKGFLVFQDMNVDKKKRFLPAEL